MQLVHQWYMSCQVRREEGRSGRIGRAVRERERPLRVDLDALRVPAGRAREREHTTPVEIARNLVSEHVRQRGHLWVEAAPDQDVGEVDPGGADVDDRAA